MFKTTMMVVQQTLLEGAMVELHFEGDTHPQTIGPSPTEWDGLKARVVIPGEQAERYPVGRRMEIRIRDLE